MKFGVMDGHHFSMMKPPHVSLTPTIIVDSKLTLSQTEALGRLIQEGLDM